MAQRHSNLFAVRQLVRARIVTSRWTAVESASGSTVQEQPSKTAAYSDPVARRDLKRKAG
jgi:hypothetical protein